jgi:putative phosphonate metabolism protein
MSQMKRFAIYYAPRPGGLATATASWFGWDPATGRDAAPPRIPGLPVPLADLTRNAARYGFHGTLKAPFRLADDIAPDHLAQATAELAARLAPVELPGLKLSVIKGFFALVPTGDVGTLSTLASIVVEALDPYRAPLTKDEFARRNPDQLTDRQRGYLTRWGYPYVKEDFQFHLTMTDHVPIPVSAAVDRAIKTHFGPVVPRPFRVEDLCIFGEDDHGRFHELARYPLIG